MNKFRPSFLTAVWLALALAAWPVLRAQETPPAPSVPAAPAPTPSTPPADDKAPAPDKPAPAAPAADEKAPAAEPAPAPALRDLTGDGEKPADAPAKKSRTRSKNQGRAPNFGDQTIVTGKTQAEAVSFAGDTVVDGHVTDAAVSVFGNTTVNGTVDDSAVSVFGTTTVNGHVQGEAVAVFGDVVLGPNAVVDGQVVAVLGKVVRDPSAQIHGGVQQIGPHRSGAPPDFTGLRAYLEECIFYARPLAFDGRLGWAWIIAFGFLAFYAFIALLAPKPINQCIDTFEQRPGYSLLSSLLTLLLTPIAFLLLILTLAIAIGFVLIPLFSIGLFLMALFGKVVILAWLGRRFTNLAGGGRLAHPFFGVLIGGLIVLGLYTIPFAGFIIYKLIGFLGLGVVVYTLIRQSAANRPPKPAPVAPPPPMPSVAGVIAPSVVPPPMPTSLPPVVSAATLPRAGFWLRFGASLVDAILVGMVCGFLSNVWHGFGVFPLWYGVYCVAMWANKGTTIGGIICNLRVVRIDDRPLDWSVATVRGLSGYLSLFVAGLGFIWVAFDDDKQSWHDKVAGTTVVRVPKGTALL